MGDRLAAFVSAVTDRVFGPVFTLDATRAGRRRSTFALRWFYLFCLVCVLAMFFYAWRRDLDATTVHPNVLTRFAENFFWVYSVTQFLLVAAVTPGVTAGAITDEKERKTLHFLLATDLTGREIVFGKLAARVGALMTLVLAGLPVIAIMQFFGGIEPRLILVAVGMTTVSVVSLSALGVVASVLLPRTRDAIMFAYGVPVVYVWLSFWAWSDVKLATEPALAEAVRLFACGNPFVAAREMARTLSDDAFPPPAAWYVGFHAAFAAAAIAVAAWRVRSSVRSEGAAAAPRSAAARTLAWVTGRRTKARWHPPLRDEPVRWRELHVEPGSGSGIVQRGFAAAVLACVFLPFLNIVAQSLYAAFDEPYSSSRGYWRSPLEEFRSATKAWVCVVTCLFGLLVLLRTTVRGASAIAGERDRDTWTSLVCTPLTVREILSGKWAGCVLGQKDAFLLLAVVWGIGVATLSVNPIGIALTAVSLAVYMNLFAALGLSASATAKNSRIAIGRSVPMTLLLVGGYWFFLSCCCAGVGLSGSSGVGEALGYVAAFVAAATPAVVLGGLPAFDLEWFREMRGRDYSVFGAMAFGWVVGVAGWTVLALYWRDQAHEGFAREANRDHELPGARPRRPRPAPREGGRPDRWNDPEPT